MKFRMSQSKLVLVIFLIAFLARFLYVSIYVGFNAVPVDDGPEWDIVARNLLERKEFSIFPGQPTSFRAPVYPFFLAFNYLIFGKKYSYVRLSQIVIGSFSCLLIYLLAKKIAGIIVGLISMLISAFYPAFIYFTGRFLSETVFIFLIISLIYILYMNQQRRDTKKECFAGLLLGLAILTRAIALFFIPFIFIWSWIVFRDKRPFLTFVRILLCTFLLVSPWTIRNYFVHHSIVPVSTNGGVTFFLSNSPWSNGSAEISYSHPAWRHFEKNYGPFKRLPSKMFMFKGLSEVETDRQFYRISLDWIRKNPARLLGLCFRKLFRQYSPIAYSTVKIARKYSWVYTISYGFIFLAAILGIIYSLKEPKKFLLFYFVLAMVTIQALIFCGNNRYRIASDPFLIILGAYGIDILLRKKKQ